jgi:hypothetical protein
MFLKTGTAEVASNRKLARWYLLPALLVTIALVITLQVAEVEPHSPFSIFLAAVAVAAYAGGWRAGLSAAFFSFLASDIFLLPPTWTSAAHSSYWGRLSASLLIDNRLDAICLGGFAFTSFVICLLAALVDHKEQALRGAQQNFTDQQREIEFLKSTAKILSWEFDLRNRRVTWTNLYSTLVMRREEPLEAWLASIHPEDRERVKAALDRALTDGEFEAEYRVLVNHSEARRVLGRAVLYSIGGHIAGLRGIEIDRELRVTAVPTGALDQRRPAAEIFR